MNQDHESTPSQQYLNAKPPQPDRAINKRSVLVVIVLLGVVLVIALNTRISTGKKTKELKTDAKGSPGLMVNHLPSLYSDMPKPPPTPLPKTLRRLDGSSKDESALKKALEKMALEKLKRAQDARASHVSFSSVAIEKHSSTENLSPTSSSSEGAQLALRQEGINPRDEANRQDEKAAFLEHSRKTGTLLTQPIVPLLSNFQLMAGSVIPGVLLTGINSDLPGEIIGQVSQSVYDTTSGNHLLIPQGTKVIGKYDSRIVYGQERVLIVWTRLIFPNGSSISLEGMPGVDMSGFAGLTDEVDNHYGKILGGVVISSLLGAGAQMAEGSRYNSVNPEFGQLAAQGAAREINQVGQEITRKNLNIQPTLVITPGYRFNIMVNKDMLLKPYAT